MMNRMMESLVPESGEGGITLATSLVQRLRRAILSGELRPGAKLRLEALREQLNLSISRSPLREALSRLGAEGLVLIEDKRGYRVMPVSEKNLREIARLRIHFEGLALREAIAEGGRRWEAGIIAAQYELDSIKRTDGMTLEQQEVWEEAHRQFHLKLLEACDMPLLLNYCRTLHDLNDRYRRLYLQKNPFDRDTRSEHAAIVEATLERNADLACALLAQHTQRTTDNIRTMLARAREEELNVQPD
ncbi:MAG: GntR family transcriptional regulator [Billgrantia sp.]|uniref:GntR family transcriptional regulator n=1 Tax=Billgrantia desiderata TaxID=52021 RepID=UPI0028A047C4